MKGIIRPRLNKLIISIFILFIILKVRTRALLGILPFRNWVINEWLIDYSAGFVRRGLSGELIKILSEFFEYRIIVGVIIWGLFIIFFLCYIRLILRSYVYLSTIILISLLFFPSLILFYLYDFGAFGRKELFGFLILFLHLFFIEKLYILRDSKKKSEILFFYLVRLLPITIIFLPAHLLIHESSFLLFVPMHIIISNQLFIRLSVNFKRRVRYLLILYSLTFLTFLAILVFGRPDFITSYMICKNLELRNAIKAGACNYENPNKMMALPASITALPWTFKQAISLTLSIPLKDLFSWIFVFLILGYSLYILGKEIIYELYSIENKPMEIFPKIYTNHVNVIFFKYLIFPMFLTTPLYLFGWDFGRWFTATCINFILVILTKELIFTDEYIFTYRKKPEILPPKLFGWQIKFLLLIGVIFFIRLPHCCIVDFNFVIKPLRLILFRLVNIF